MYSRNTGKMNMVMMMCSYAFGQILNKSEFAER